MYWILRSQLRDDSALIGSYPTLPVEISWVGGRRIGQPVPEPLVFQLLEDGGTWMPAFFAPGIPLMRADLLDGLERAGVANLDRYTARIEDPRGGPPFTDYSAVNVIGVVSATDMEQSLYDRASPSRMIDVDFDSIVVNEAKAGSALLFRLAECVSAIVVHDAVRRQVEPLQLPGVAFARPEQVIT
jgi:hypothetical protein